MSDAAYARAPLFLAIVYGGWDKKKAFQATFISESNKNAQKVHLQARWNIFSRPLIASDPIQTYHLC